MDSTEDALPSKEVHHSDRSSPEEQRQLHAAVEELEKWKKKVEEAEHKKSKLLIEKVDSETAKKRVQVELLALTQRPKREGPSLEMKTGKEDRNLDLEGSHSALLAQLKQCEEVLKRKRAESATLQQKLKITAEIPVKKVMFTGVEKEAGENYGNTVSVISITQRPTFLLKGCQALITFEEEEVAETILKQTSCQVKFGSKKIDVLPQPVTLGTSAKFEIRMEVSKSKMRFSEAPPILPEGHMRDRLEACFSKPSRGGGEVLDLSYDKNTGSGLVTFLNPGVAENLILKKKYCLDANRKTAVSTFPSLEYQLEKLQIFHAVTKRTVLLDGIEDILEEEDQQDTLEIHFQKPTNHGGEVECIKYLSKGKHAEVYFAKDTT